ncbi:preprotein translocase subunit YajC [Candidatus Rariloculus sp.]|uniref:preprotein translocase subunit YajC n=1 Tax=Candidatus Rariloculus sp. TaxID=3101265 RepID=UPI003D139DE8
MESLVGIFVDTAWAQDAGGQGTLFSFLPLIVIFVLFYFLLIRPQTKKQKEHRAMVEALGTGDEVVTGGGVLGKVTGAGQDFITVEVADNVSIKVRRQTISAVMPKGTMKNV